MNDNNTCTELGKGGKLVVEVVTLCLHTQNCTGFIADASTLIENGLELQEQHEVPVQNLPVWNHEHIDTFIGHRE